MNPAEHVVKEEDKEYSGSVPFPSTSGKCLPNSPVSCHGSEDSVSLGSEDTSTGNSSVDSSESVLLEKSNYCSVIHAMGSSPCPLPQKNTFGKKKQESKGPNSTLAQRQLILRAKQTGNSSGSVPKPVTYSTYLPMSEWFLTGGYSLG